MPTYFLALLFSIFTFINTCYAQQKLVFENLIDHKVTEINTKDLIKFEYKGYLRQSESIYGTVTELIDSMITIQSLEKFRNVTLKIHVKDITGFRRFNKSRLYLEPAISVGVTVSSIFLFYWIEQNHPSVGFGARLGISVGVSIVSSGISKLIFNKKIHQKVSYGWQMSLK